MSVNREVIQQIIIYSYNELLCKYYKNKAELIYLHIVMERYSD